MLEKSAKIWVRSVQNYTMNVSLNLGTYNITESLPILCPNQTDKGINHLITKNGHDTSIKSKPQQYLCKTCLKSFYAYTSKFFISLQIEFKKVLSDVIKGGSINITPIANRLQLQKSAVSRLIGKILENVIISIKKNKSFLKKRRKSCVLIVDETFIKIHKKTWYLILVISGNNKVMSVRLVERRDKETILDIIKDCERRLLYGLQMLISDGFQVYIGVALELKHELIHVRHIHKPPYGRIEIHHYSYRETELIVTKIETTNEITKVNGYFLARVKEDSKPINGGKKRGRKPGTKNRPKKVIKEERKRKEKDKKPRGRPLGSKKPSDEMQVHVFFHNKEEGVIRNGEGSSVMVAAVLNKILKQFPDMFVTTNLVEKEFSVLKKLLCFRGRRDAELWVDLITAYYAIRDEPKILEKALKLTEISSKMTNQAFFALITGEICV